MQIYDMQMVKEFVKENSNCELLAEEYINYNTKMDFKCECGNTFTTDFAKFKTRNKRQCNECGQRLRNKDTRFTLEDVKLYVSNNSDCELLSTEYIDNRSLLKFKCNCGEIFYSTFQKFKYRSKVQCNKCGIEIRANLKRKTQSQFKEQIETIYKGEYTVLGDYMNDFTKILVKHNVCGYEYEVRPSNILKGRKCPICTSSNGEYYINNWLIENNINYEREYSFDNLLSDLGNPLRFDFAIFELDKLKLIIEFDGEQHYTRKDGWQSMQDFKKLQHHDYMKNEYCKNHNIKLVRIKYNETENIDKILKSAIC